MILFCFFILSHFRKKVKSYFLGHGEHLYHQTEKKGKMNTNCPPMNVFFVNSDNHEIVC